MPSSESSDDEVPATQQASAIVKRCLTMIGDRLDEMEPGGLEVADLHQLAQTARALTFVRDDAGKKDKGEQTYQELLERARKIPELREALMAADDE